MGQLRKGRWVDGDKPGDNLHHLCPVPRFDKRIDSAANAVHPAGADRYHLFVTLASPWAHWTHLVLVAKGLEQAIRPRHLDPVLTAQGWAIRGRPGARRGPRYLHELFTKTDPDFTGPVTPPILWDDVQGRIVSNDPAAIAEMLNGAFENLASSDRDLRPENLVPAIDRVCSFVSERLAKALYKLSRARDRRLHDRVAGRVFEALDRLERLLESMPFLAGPQLTEADLLTFAALVRYEVVHDRFLGGERRPLRGYPSLSRHMLTMYRTPGLADTVDFELIKQHFDARSAASVATG